MSICRRSERIGNLGGLDGLQLGKALGDWPGPDRAVLRFDLGGEVLVAAGGVGGPPGPADGDLERPDVRSW